MDEGKSGSATSIVSIVGTNPNADPGQPLSVVWKLGEGVPGSGGSAQIQRMYLDDETGDVEVFAKPIPASPLAGAGKCLHFRVTAPNVKLVCQIVDEAEWVSWIRDMEEQEAEEPPPPAAQAAPGMDGASNVVPMRLGELLPQIAPPPQG